MEHQEHKKPLQEILRDLLKEKKKLSDELKEIEEKVKHLVVKLFRDGQNELRFPDGDRILKRKRTTYIYNWDVFATELDDDQLKKCSKLDAKLLEATFLEKYGDSSIAKAKVSLLRTPATESYSFELKESVDEDYGSEF
jgi:hypothetical protein